MNRVIELRHVAHPKRSPGVSDVDFLDPRPHGVHGFPIIRLPAQLHLVQLVAGLAAGAYGEVADVIQSAAPELDRLGASGHSGRLYKILYDWQARKIAQDRPLRGRRGHTSEKILGQRP